MGACASSIAGGGDFLIDATDGDYKKYHERFIEDGILGKGEFGVVKCVRETSKSDVKLACKSLRKGIVFKDNQLYPPLPAAMLLGEIEMLRALRWPSSTSKKDNFCLQLHSVYESPKEILLVTELCKGGDMMQYVAKQKSDLRTEDVSRIAQQLLIAIDHCAQQKIIHRDIKPQNIMFQDVSPQSPLRLIDFGAGALDTEYMANLLAEDGAKSVDSSHLTDRHTTFAGTPFYNSPEMFQNKYTQKTDIFSVGVTLYVLTAGYPADQLQKAFNILQKSSKGGSRDMKNLPNLPQNMPDSYYDMLEDLLAFQPKIRKTAHEMLSHSFVTFHQDLLLADKNDEENGAVSSAPDTRPSTLLRRQSILIEGSVDRHTSMLTYKKFERSLTTLLATMLDKADLVLLVNILKHATEKETDNEEDGTSTAIGETAHTSETNGSSISFNSNSNEASPGIEQLGVVRLFRLNSILEEDLFRHDIVEMIDDLPNASKYRHFAYHTGLLTDIGKASKKLTLSTEQQRRLSKSAKRSSSAKSLNRSGSMREVSSSGGSVSFRNSSRRQSIKKETAKEGSSGASKTVKSTPKARAQSVMIRGV